MAQEEEHSEDTQTTVTVSELPAKPFSIILEVALCMIMMGLTLSGK